MKQKRSPKKPNIYFTQETENAIVLYTYKFEQLIQFAQKCVSHSDAQLWLTVFASVMGSV